MRKRSTAHTLLSSFSTVWCLDFGKDAVTICLINSVSDCNSWTPVASWIAFDNLVQTSENQRSNGRFLPGSQSHYYGQESTVTSYKNFETLNHQGKHKRSNKLRQSSNGKFDKKCERLGRGLTNTNVNLVLTWLPSRALWMQTLDS